jgi:hypothetical protein
MPAALKYPSAIEDITSPHVRSTMLVPEDIAATGVSLRI